MSVAKAKCHVVRKIASPDQYCPTGRIFRVESNVRNSVDKQLALFEFIWLTKVTY